MKASGRRGESVAETRNIREVEMHFQQKRSMWCQSVNKGSQKNLQERDKPDHQESYFSNGKRKENLKIQKVNQ